MVLTLIPAIYHKYCCIKFDFRIIIAYDSYNNTEIKSKVKTTRVVTFTPFLRCHLKTTNKLRDLKPLSLSVFCFALACQRISIKMHSIESRLLWDRKTYCLQASTGILQPGKFAGWGSEGVKFETDTELL